LTGRIGYDSIRPMRQMRKRPLSSRLTKALAPATALSFILYFGFHLVDGRNGILALQAYEERLPELEAQAADLNEKKLRLEQRIAHLHPDHVDPDLLDEMVRKQLGYAHEDEKIIKFDGN